MIRELTAIFKFSLVLADSLYGESNGNFISVLNELKLNFAVAIRSNHGVWLPPGQTVRYNKWRKFTRIFSDGTDEIRYIREIILASVMPFNIGKLQLTQTLCLRILLGG
jgi:SRSO17 transposase